ncbi:MAG: hypothetical protein ABI641_15915 [Caldimonas sp.]
MADDAALIADVAADDAASIADVAASEAAMLAEAASAIGGGVTTTAVGAAGVVVVVVVSSFLLHAANDTAAASETINKAFFIFLLDFQVRTITVQLWETPQRGPPSLQAHEKRDAFPAPNPTL